MGNFRIFYKRLAHTFYLRICFGENLICRCIYPFAQVELGYSFIFMSLLFVGEKEMFDGF